MTTLTFKNNQLILTRENGSTNAYIFRDEPRVFEKAMLDYLADLDGEEPGANIADWAKLDNPDLIPTSKIPIVEVAGELTQIGAETSNLNLESKDGIVTINGTKQVATSDSLNNYVPNTRKVAGKPLSSDVSISSGDLTDSNTIVKLIEGKIPTKYTSAIDTYPTIDDFPVPGDSGIIYVTEDTEKAYRWSGSSYVGISSSLVIGETTGTAFDGGKGKSLENRVNSLGSGVVGNSLQLGASNKSLNLNSKGPVMINSTKEIITAEPYPGQEGRKVIPLENSETLSGLSSDGSTSGNLLMIDQSDIANFGSKDFHTNLNVKENNGHNGRITVNDENEIAYVDDTTYVTNIPIGSELNEVYDSATIFGWFGVKDLVELKTLFTSRRLSLRYGVTHLNNSNYYNIPIQLAELKDDNTIFIVAVGLDTSNDKASKYEITIKLDGTLITENSNIEVKVTPIEIDPNEYVRAEEGKGLSTNDFTNEDKNKLDNIRAYTFGQPTSIATQIGSDQQPVVDVNLTGTDNKILEFSFQIPKAEGLTGKVISVSKIADTSSASAAEIAAKINEIIDALAVRGVITTD